MTQPMQRELETLVRKLDSKVMVHWVEEMRLGRPAYDHLIACVRARTLTRNQMANAFHALLGKPGWKQADGSGTLGHRARPLNSPTSDTLLSQMKIGAAGDGVREDIEGDKACSGRSDSCIRARQ